MTMRRSLPALDRLYYEMKTRVSNLHYPEIKRIKAEIAELDERRAKEIIADVEAYAFGKYPELRKVLKCESGNSQLYNGQVKLGFWFDGERSPLASQLRLFIVQEEESLAEDEKVLDRWKMGCLKSMAAGMDFPEIGISGIDDVSGEPKYG
jgi:hypothetical protein